MIVIALIALALHWWFFQAETRKPGIVVRPLLTCHLEWRDRWGVVLFVCPGQEVVKVWPMPLEYNWIEIDFKPQERTADKPPQGGFLIEVFSELIM